MNIEDLAINDVVTTDDGLHWTVVLIDLDKEEVGLQAYGCSAIREAVTQHRLPAARLRPWNGGEPYPGKPSLRKLFAGQQQMLTWDDERGEFVWQALNEKTGRWEDL